jgi:glycosyltransferase involved in cell wall biosynthesis
MAAAELGLDARGTGGGVVRMTTIGTLTSPALESQTRPAPKFSIVVPAYQAADTISQTLEAISEQTFPEWECIVVDDGSTDATLEIGRSYSKRDARINVLHQDNQGTGGAYNTGVGAASAPWIVLCSADDLLLPEHLASMSRFMESEPGYQIYTSNGFISRSGMARTPVYDGGPWQNVRSLDLASVIRVCFFGVGAVFAKGIVSAVGGFRTNIFAEDYDFWLRAMAGGARHRYTPALLSVWRVSATQKSADLHRVYRTDIQLVTELSQTHSLSPSEVEAVARSIHDRERLIRELTQRRYRVYRERIRPVLRGAIVAVLGRDRARDVKRSVLSALGRDPQPGD